MSAPRTPMKPSRILRTAVLGAALVAIAGSIAAAPARADDWHHRHEWRGHHGPYVYVAPRYPGYVYAPPPPVVYAPPPAVVYAPPPPVVYAPPPVPAVAGVNVVFPIHIR